MSFGIFMFLHKWLLFSFCTMSSLSHEHCPIYLHLLLSFSLSYLQAVSRPLGSLKHLLFCEAFPFYIIKWKLEATDI